MKKLQQAKSPKVEQKPDSIAELNETLKKVQVLLAAQQAPVAAPKKLQQATPVYQPPQLIDSQPLLFNTQTYQLQEPIVGTEPLLSNYQKLYAPVAQPQLLVNAYPQIQVQKQAPNVMLQQFAQAQQFAQPQQFAQQQQMTAQFIQQKPKALPELSKADLAKILLSMIAKDGDLEA